MDQNRLTLTVEEAAEILGISRAFAYKLVKKEELPIVRLGRRVVVPRRALETMLKVATEDDSPPKDVRLGHQGWSGASANPSS